LSLILVFPLKNMHKRCLFTLGSVSSLYKNIPALSKWNHVFPAEGNSVFGAPLFSKVQKPRLVSASVHFVACLQDFVVEVLRLVSVDVVSGSSDRLIRDGRK